MAEYAKRISIGQIKDDLADYGFYLTHGKKQRENIKRIEMQMTSVKGMHYSPVPASGGGSRQEDRLVDLIMRKDKLKRDLEEGEQLEEEFESYFKSMDPMEVDIIKTLWVYHERDGVRVLSDRYNYSVSNIYHISDRSLSTIARMRYGVK